MKLKLQLSVQLGKNKKEKKSGVLRIYPANQVSTDQTHVCFALNRSSSNQIVNKDKCSDGAGLRNLLRNTNCLSFSLFFLPVPVMVWTSTVSVHGVLHVCCSCRERDFSSVILLSLDVIKLWSSLGGGESNKRHEILSNKDWIANVTQLGVQP